MHDTDGNGLGRCFRQLNAVLCHRCAAQVSISYIHVLRRHLFRWQSALLIVLDEVDLGTPVALLFFTVVICHMLMVSKLLVLVLLSLVKWHRVDVFD